MGAYTSVQAGEFNLAATWGAADYPDGADDTVSTGHAVTNSSGINCGATAVTSGGSLVASGTNIITSITNSAGGNITLGPTTMAGVLTNRNAANCLLTINGVITGVTDFTPNDCAMNANVTVSGILYGPSASRTLTIAADKVLSGMTGMPGTEAGNVGGSIYMNAGSAIEANMAAEFTLWFIATSPGLTVRGTSAKVVRFENINGAYNFMVRGRDSLTFDIEQCDLYGCIWTATTGNWGLMAKSVMFAPKVAAPIISGQSLRFCLMDKIWVAGAAGTTHTLFSGLNSAPHHRISNLAIGYKRDGSANPLTAGISGGATLAGACVRAHFQNAIINATTPVVLPLTSDRRPSSQQIVIDHYGYVDPGMVADASALAAAVVAPGITKTWSVAGTVERSVANPRTGTSHSRMTPSSIVTATAPVSQVIHVPITIGQNLSVSVYASRSGMTSDCAVVAIDPEHSFFDTPVDSTELLTNVATYYQLTASATNARATGLVRLEYRLLEFENGHYVDWDDFSFQVT